METRSCVRETGGRGMVDSDCDAGPNSTYGSGPVDFVYGYSTMQMTTEDAHVPGYQASSTLDQRYTHPYQAPSLQQPSQQHLKFL